MVGEFNAASRVQQSTLPDSAFMAGSEPSIGVYEKALDVRADWDGLLRQAANAGFNFLEMSIDDAPHRLARLAWSQSQRAEVRAVARQVRLPIESLTLSAHRRYALGSSDTATRLLALDILKRAITLASDVGAQLVQIAGYFTYQETRQGGERSRFVDGLRQGAEWARKAQVMLGLENMDGDDVVSVRDALSVISEVGGSRLWLYPDIGNLAANGLDVCAELALAAPHLLALQLKDSRLGEFRRVPFGEGIVPFRDAFALLARLGFDGPFVLEMWNDKSENPSIQAAQGRQWILDEMKNGGFM